MPVSAFEYRYGSNEVRAIFDRKNWLNLMLKVEGLLAWALAEVNLIPTEAGKTIRKVAEEGKLTISDIEARERVVRHETMAVVLALAEKCGEYGKYVHYGVTSNDILDTVLAVQIKEAGQILKRKLSVLIRKLCELALEHKETVCLGRTHGRAALPITFGFKLAVFASELARGYERLARALEDAARGKIAGAVGTMAELGEKGWKVRDLVMKELGIEACEIATQIVPRDSLANLLVTMALISSTLDKLANEVRNLQRSEIGEVEEPFVAGQIGSSTMPQKRNPVMSEKVCGLARLARGLAVGALENVVLEHERDLTNSSFERIAVPEMFLILDEQLDTCIEIFGGLKVNADRMRENVLRFAEEIMTERVMLEVVKRGGDRNRCLVELRNCVLEATGRGKRLTDVIAENEYIAKYVTREELRKLMNPFTYLGTATRQVEEVVKNILSRVSKS